MEGFVHFAKKQVKVIKKDQSSYQVEKEEVQKIEFDEDLSGDKVDIVFCIDTTGSMSSFITFTKNILTNLISHFKNISNLPLFGIVAYRDHPPQEKTYVTQVHNLGPADEALQYLKSIDASGGGDVPEAVLQGLWDSLTKINWRDLEAKSDENKAEKIKKVLFHIGDAPAHGKEFHDLADDAWKNGCPSGIKLQQLADKMNEYDVNYYFCALNTTTAKMADLFKKSFKKFEPLDLIPKESPDCEYVDEEEYEKMKDKYEIADAGGKAFEAKVMGAILGEMKKK